MAESKSYSYSDVAAHNTKKDLWVVVHDKVYDIGSFVDEHPGGEEVLLDVGGQDSSEAFEDVGHSDEAREILEKLLVGTLERKEGDPAPKVAPPSSTGLSGIDSGTGGLGGAAYFAILAVAALAYYAYSYLQPQQQSAGGGGMKQ